MMTIQTLRNPVPITHSIYDTCSTIRLQGLTIRTVGQKRGARTIAAEWTDQTIVNAIVDEKEIAAWPAGHIGVGAVHGVALEHHQGAGGAFRRFDTALEHQLLQADVVGYSHILALERLLVVIRWRTPYAGHKAFMRTGNQHQEAIEFTVVGKNDGAAQRAHARHAIFTMPSLEVRMPVEPLALEARLIVDPRLVNINSLSQQLFHHRQQARVPGQAAEALGNFVNTENGANFLPTGLQHCAFRELEVALLFIVTQLLNEGFHLLSREKPLERKKALLFVLTHLRFTKGSRSTLCALSEHNRIDSLEHAELALQARRKQIPYVMLHCLVLLDLNEIQSSNWSCFNLDEGACASKGSGRRLDTLLSRADLSCADRYRSGGSCQSNAAQAA